MLHRFANPTRFLRLADIIQPWMAWATVLLMGAGLYMGLVVAPADYQQGESVRIMYVHVPSSWMALFCYTGMAISAAVGLIWKHPLADLIAKSTAPIGASFAFLSLLTGSLWGKPMWGTYWVWDARLTSMLVLLFLYLGYMALIEAFDDPTRGTRASSILVLVGVVNVPIIKFSVDWWNTLHQPSSVLKMSGPSIDASMLWPLLLMALAFTTYYLWVMLIRVRAEVAANRIRNLRFRQARGQGED
ncbi:MAG: heme ABC transporter permease [Rhodospirillaceae bacterium]|jgi:heme exporter protein C|nr:heme ABC transporter permease [Rhodospirillaceae bacterium]MBT5307953.1 heme ABC transporter permease [Rhodospirillaceae bacterium]MBT7355298.1 heme ABC transporter permease [Rhodospirillaceae bacterium]